MVQTEGTYIQVAYKNAFGHISTNSWPFFMIQRPTIREECAWVILNTWRDQRPVTTGPDRFFSVLDFSTNLATGNRKFSEFVQLQPVVQSFAVGFSSISVFFAVQRTVPVNTSWYPQIKLPVTSWNPTGCPAAVNWIADREEVWCQSGISAFCHHSGAQMAVLSRKAVLPYCPRTAAGMLNFTQTTVGFRWEYMGES